MSCTFFKKNGSFRGVRMAPECWTARISRLDDLLDKEREANAKLTDLVYKLIEKCDQCEFHRKQGI